MASRHSHAPTNDSRLSMSCGFRGAGLMTWEAAGLRRDAIASYVCLVSRNSKLNNSKSQAKPRIIQNSPLLIQNSVQRTDKLQFIGEFAMVGRALTKTFIHNPLMLFEPSAIHLWYIWSYENKFSRPYMP